jgi:tagatose-1,6-bisphosphate aldolase non-catalytic subunit AgaZ/GatZ
MKDLNDSCKYQPLSSLKVNITGAVAILNIGSWLTFAANITHHKIGSDQFE